jgi:hypothetical protein
MARLGTAFSETFSLSRASIKQLVEAIAGQEGHKTELSRFDLLREETNLGTNYVKAMPRYAKGAGILDESSALTDFGRAIFQKDPLLAQHSTQWLMHYFLSAPHGPGPAFWHHLVVSCFRTHSTFSREQILTHIGAFIEQTEGKTLSDRSIAGAANAFLGTYHSEEGLGELEIIEKIGDTSYRVLEPEAPLVWVIAYTLIDFWLANFPQQITLNLNDLSGPNGLTSIFMVSAGRLNRVLRAMQEEGYVEVHRVAPPYQVVLLNQDRTSLLERIYGYD